MTFNAFAIPKELRELPHWCMWKLEYPNGQDSKPTKVPYQISGGKSSTVDRTTWNSFEACFNAYQFGGFDGLGFIFTESGYAGIDLDDPQHEQTILVKQLQIAKDFDSYSEISPSGKGLHIIVKGHVPAGRRRGKIELYSSGRFFTMTGNAYLDRPVAERQEMLDVLWEELGAGISQSIYKGELKEIYKDDEIIKIASSASNGDKFIALHSGRWRELYPSQSEADYAYIDILAFYSRNKQQIWRIYANSMLGTTDKKRTRPDYVERMINRSFDNMLPPIDLDGIHNAIELKLAKSEIETPKKEYKSSIKLPPGLIGEIAQFIYSAAPRPVEEIALAGALALMSGICGRAYNVSSTGLNQYILMIAGTGVGKEAAASGISKIMNEVKLHVPSAHEFIGPSEISSGPALFKYIGTQSKSFVSLLGEFGLRLQQLSNANANGSEVSLRRMLLDLFNKSGYGDTLYKSIYSDKDKNTPDIQSPALSIYGESTPERFYGALSEDMISEGLLPRFHIIEYRGPRRDLNEAHSSIHPSKEMIEKLSAICAHTLTINNAQPRRVMNVEISAPALQILNNFDRLATNNINSNNKTLLKELWNRAHIKALKLSALIAVGVNYAYPMINEDHVNWAIDLIMMDIEALSYKFEEGIIGGNDKEAKQLVEVMRVSREFIMKDWSQLSSYGIPKILHDKKIIPYVYIQRRLTCNTAFNFDKTKGMALIYLKRSIQTLIETGRLRELTTIDLKNINMETSAKHYVLLDTTGLNR
jgi:hypothetical protein